MFTGIIRHIGAITTRDEKADLRITVSCAPSLADVRIGDSVACNGCCLTVVEIKPSAELVFSLSQETLERTAPNSWDIGKKLHLEPAMRMGDRLDGHMVSGHVDGVAKIIEIAPVGDSYSMGFEAPESLAKFMAEKGSVTLDGVSLTVNQVTGARFWVNIIPHTWQETTLGKHAVGDYVNLEIDLIARYVARLLTGA